MAAAIDGSRMDSPIDEYIIANPSHEYTNPGVLLITAQQESDESPYF